MRSPDVDTARPSVDNDVAGEPAARFDGSGGGDPTLAAFAKDQGATSMPERVVERRPAPPEPESMISAERRQAMRGAFEASRTDLTWSREENALPPGVRFARIPLGHEGGADGYTFTALVPAGALVPGAEPRTLDAARSFFVERSGGLAGTTRVAGPISVAE